MNAIRGFWQHTNGKIYAIESTTFGKIIGGVGPLNPDDLRNLEEYDCKPAIKEWLKKAVTEGKLRRINPH